MAGRIKNIGPTLSDFLRYIGQKMSGSERNSFERELQKDPFAEDAAEGFEGMPPVTIERDIRKLRKKIRSGTRDRRKVNFYRVAAFIAVLITISSLFVILKYNKPAGLVSENKSEHVFEITKSPALSKSNPNDQDKIALNEETKGGSVKKGEPVMSEQKVILDLKLKDKPVQPDSINRNLEPVSAPARKEPQLLAVNPEDARALSRSVSKQAAGAEQIVLKGKVMSSEDNMPIPGATVTVKGTSLGTLTDTGGNFLLKFPDTSSHSLVASFIGMESKEFITKADSVVQVSLNPSIMALNEVVVVGYGTQKTTERNMTGAVSTVRYEDAKMRTSYTPPQPVNGRDNFDKYIESNIRRPAGTKTGEREVVVVSFTVKSSGILENLKIIRSPGKPFSDEAIRLINQGPAWKPAEENDLKIDDEVRIRILFK